ncbi:N-acetyltransferase family protein [Arsenicicoccus dermatophilus]|uniref:GNAT family N-acetyltransferase n=1 Tax=Arsenicicoccus dermatophilus TaxID=1076331 RepID=UPI0039173D84
MDFHVRVYEPGDRDEIVGMADRLTVGVAPWRDREAVVAAVRGWVTDAVDRAGTGDDRVVLVAEQAGVVVGFISTEEQRHWSGQLDVYVGELVVREDREGYGIGRALVRAVEEWARGRGVARIRLTTGAANDGALGLYEAVGYEREDITLSRAL